jgi:hypothetical protein
MLLPSNAIPTGPEPTAKVPRGPHVCAAAVLHVFKVALHTPAPKAAAGPSGARQSVVGASHRWQGPPVQSLFLAHRTHASAGSHAPVGDVQVCEEPGTQPPTVQVLAVVWTFPLHEAPGQAIGVPATQPRLTLQVLGGV